MGKFHANGIFALMYAVLTVSGQKEGKTILKPIANTDKSPYYTYNKYKFEGGKRMTSSA